MSNMIVESLYRVSNVEFKALDYYWENDVYYLEKENE